MTLNSNAKVAGFAILVYLAAGISSMAVAANAAALLAVVQSFCALLLGVTFYVITREQDPHLALGGSLLPPHRSRPRSWRDLLRGRQHDLFLAAAPRADDSRRLGVARCDRVGRTGSPPFRADRRVPWRPQKLGVTSDVGRMVADAGVRTSAGSLAHYEGHREADNIRRNPAR